MLPPAPSPPPSPAVPRRVHVLRADPVDLRLFLAVLDTGTLTAGAACAHLSPGAASERLQALEDALGTTLFERSHRGSAPTAAGLVLAGHARRVLLQLDRLASDLAPFVAGSRGHVRLMCNTAAATEHLPAVLARHLAAHPDIDVTVEEAWSHDILRALHDGRAEVGLLADAVDARGLQSFVFRHDRLVLLEARQDRATATATATTTDRDVADPATTPPPVAFADLLDRPFVGLEAGSALQRFLDDQAARCGRSLHYRVRLRGFDALCQLAAAGVGAAVLPLAAARRFADPRATVCTPLADGWARRRLLVCTRDLTALPRATQDLVAALRAAADETGAQADAFTPPGQDGPPRDPPPPAA